MIRHYPALSPKALKVEIIFTPVCLEKYPCFSMELASLEVHSLSSLHPMFSDHCVPRNRGNGVTLGLRLQLFLDLNALPLTNVNRHLSWNGKFALYANLGIPVPIFNSCQHPDFITTYRPNSTFTAVLLGGLQAQFRHPAWYFATGPGIHALMPGVRELMRALCS